MRVLNIVHGPFWAGPHNRIDRLAGPLRSRGWHSMVVHPDRPASAHEVAARHRANGVEAFPVPLGRIRRTNDLWTHMKWGVGFGPDVFRLLKVISRSDPDVVLVGGLANLQGGFAAALAGKPLVWQITDTATPMAVVRVAMPFAERVSNALMFDGELVRRMHVKNGVPRTKWCDYLPPVVTSEFVPSVERRFSTRQALGVPQGATVVGMVANITPPKGIEHFLRCAARILPRFSGVHFVCVGGILESQETYAHSIYRLAGELQLPPDRFVFAGRQQDVAAFYAAFDIKVISSVPYSEGTTTTAMEAASCGVPVVASDVGAVREVVAQEETGIVVPPENEEALVAAVRRLIEVPREREKFGEAARERAVREFDVERCAEVHENAFMTAVYGCGE